MKKLHLFKTMLLLCALIVGSGTMWGTTAAGTFIINFYDSSKLSSTSGTGLTNSNYSSFVDVPSGATATDVVTSVSVTGTVQYGKNGGLTAGTATAAGQNSHYVTFNIGNDYKVTKCTVYATAYESGRWLLNGNAASSGSLGSKGATIDKVTSPLVWNNLGGLSSLTFKKDNGSGGNQKRLTIYKIVCEYQVTVVATDLDVKTAPTKVNYKVGETLDLTGLVLDATVGGNHVDVTSGYTAKIGETTVTSGTTTLNDVGAQTITFTYGGQTTTQTIHVGDLESIALTTTGVKTTYDEGQTFDPENLVVTATYSDGEDTPTTWTEDVTASCSYDPDGALETTDDNVEVSYTWGSTTKTANITITVNDAVPYTVTFNAGTGTCGTSSLTEATGLAGVTLPSATGISGWDFAGWATAATENTEVAPTLYTAGSTYHPIDNCTLYAVYSFSDVSSTNYSQATTLDEITSASSIVIVNGSYVLDNTLGGSVAAPTITDGIMEPNSKDIFTLTGNNTEGFTLKNGTKRLGGASSSDVTLATDASNYLWTFAKIGETTNFQVLSKDITGEALERYKPKSGSYSWKTYTASTTDIYQMKIFVPAETTVYNSNPAAIINPTVAFTTAGNKALYVQNEKSYTNVANVTGIAKTPVYTSSDVTVATVSDAGVVTALKAGTTTITATVAAEVGVNTKASASYVVTVKDASNIAGLKDITNESSVVAFTADLTDAVVTYVDGDYSYIQDASGAVYASCGSSLTAGNKINGAISGSIKAAYKIDEITAIDLSEATVTEDGIIPAADVKTLAEIKEAGTNYDGKLVTVNGLKVTTALTDDANGDITDDGGTTTFKLVCPYEGVNADRYAEGNITGFISIYNASTYRLNIYDQSQIVLTKNAPTAQTLSFESDAIELDEETTAFAEFTGQAVEGAQGTVTYAITGDAIGTVNAETGVVTLNGAYGTATITATAAAKEITEAGVTTPYTETAKSYTVTVNPRYFVVFSVNGIETTVRQAASGAPIAVPAPADVDDYAFRGWSTSTVSPTNDEPEMEDLGSTLTPTDNSGKYYAVFAKQTVGDDENVELYKNTGSTGTDATSGITASGNINPNNGNSKPSFGLTSAGNSTITFTDIDISGCTSGTIKFDYQLGKYGTSYTKLTVTQYDSSDETIGEATQVTGTNNGDYLTCSPISLSTSCVKLTIVASTPYPAYVDNVIINVMRPSITYKDYRTSLPNVEVTISESKFLSFCYGSKLDFSETDVKAYKASVDGEGKVTLTKVDVVPAEQGVILHCETPGTYSVPVTEAAASDVTGNQMVGVLERTQVVWNPTTGIYNYILQQGKFNNANGGYLKANRAYLSTDYDVTSVGAHALEIVFDEGETTAISEVRGLKSEVRGEFFNLNGQRVATPVKGNIYIVNGKKVMFK